MGDSQTLSPRDYRPLVDWTARLSYCRCCWIMLLALVFQLPHLTWATPKHQLFCAFNKVRYALPVLLWTASFYRVLYHISTLIHYPFYMKIIPIHLLLRPSITYSLLQDFGRELGWRLLSSTLEPSLNANKNRWLIYLLPYVLYAISR